MVQIKTLLANPKNYGSVRSLNTIEYIVIHYTANDGDSDENNAKYFHNNVVKTSAHYFVDDDSITQSVLDNQIAWSVGGGKYSDCSKLGGGKFYQKCTNTNSISIELCDNLKNGVIKPNQKTIDNAIELTKMLMAKYNIPADRVIRHADVNGKHCPSYWYGCKTNDNLWKLEFHDKLTEDTTSILKEFKVKVIVNSLNVRASASSLSKKVGCITDKGTYTIVKLNSAGTWGMLKSGLGWISLNSKYVSKL